MDNAEKTPNTRDSTELEWLIRQYLEQSAIPRKSAKALLARLGTAGPIEQRFYTFRFAEACRATADGALEFGRLATEQLNREATLAAIHEAPSRRSSFNKVLKLLAGIAGIGTAFGAAAITKAILQHFTKGSP